MMALGSNLSDDMLERSIAMFSKFPKDSLWLLDGGSTDHLSSVRSDFFEFIPVTGERYVEGINCKVEGIGSVRVIVTLQNGKKRQIILTKVLYCPDLPKTSKLQPKRLFSQATAEAQGNDFHYTRTGRYITMKDGQNITIHPLGNMNLYFLELQTITFDQKPDVSNELKALAIVSDKQDEHIAEMDEHFAFNAAEMS
jgi:hypothetical protein